MKKVLYAEDELHYRQFGRKVLTERMELDVQVAEDGVFAMKMLEMYLPDLVILDLDMPKMGGFAVLEAMREHRVYKYIPVVIFTAHDGEDVMRKAMKLGANSIVLKPESVESFETEIGHVLELFSQPPKRWIDRMRNIARRFFWVFEPVPLLTKGHDEGWTRKQEDKGHFEIVK